MRLGSRYERAVRKLERLAELWNFALLSAVAAGFLTGMLSEFFVGYPIRRWLQALFLVLIAVPVWAGDRGTVAQVEQIRVTERGIVEQFGTAIRLADHPDGRSTWLTAGHSVTRGRVKVDSLQGECVERSDEPDLALILAEPAQGNEWFILDESVPSTASLHGFGRVKGHTRRVSISRKVASGYEHRGPQLSGDCWSDYGDSGSPLYEYNRLYGVQWGADKPGETTSVYFTPTREVKRWVEKVGYRYCWQWQVTPNCPNGQCSQPPIVRPVLPKPIVVPAPDTSHILDRIRCLEEASAAQTDALRELQDLKRRVGELEARKLTAGPAGPPGPAGPRGHDGAQGPAGKPGVITVILEENGKQLQKTPDVVSGSTVRYPIRRTEKTSTGSN